MSRLLFSLTVLLSPIALVSAFNGQNCASAPPNSVCWDGTFNYYSKSTDFNAWSFGNDVGQYQSYIFGDNPATVASQWFTLSPAFAQPAHTAWVKQGCKVSINASSSWHGQQMLRSELIAGNGPLGKNIALNGKIYIRFSILQPSTDPLDTKHEHQLVFFENHLCDIIYGSSNGNSNIMFRINFNNPIWSQPFKFDTWHNFAVEVDYNKRTCGLYWSTGSSPLPTTPTVAATSYTNGGSDVNDLHIGILRTPPLTGSPYGSVVYSSVFIANSLTVTPTLSGPTLTPTASASPSPSPTGGATTNPGSGGTTTSPSGGGSTTSPSGGGSTTGTVPPTGTNPPPSSTGAPTTDPNAGTKKPAAGASSRVSVASWTSAWILAMVMLALVLPL